MIIQTNVLMWVGLGAFLLVVARYAITTFITHVTLGRRRMYSKIAFINNVLYFLRVRGTLCVPYSSGRHRVYNIVNFASSSRHTKTVKTSSRSAAAPYRRTIYCKLLLLFFSVAAIVRTSRTRRVYRGGGVPRFILKHFFFSFSSLRRQPPYNTGAYKRRRQR